MRFTIKLWKGYSLILNPSAMLNTFFEGVFFALGVLVVVLLLFQCAPAKAAATTQAQPPRAALAHKDTLVRAARYEFGLAAPVALLAAQVHAESGWNAAAKSPVGAQGMAQFMPATAKWMPEIDPALAGPAPFNPGWALRALAAYDHWLHDRIPGVASACHRWAFVLSAYNGGLGWVQRDRSLAAKLGKDSAHYWGQVERVNAGRSAANIRENRAYPKRIFALAPVYSGAGWGPGVPGVPCE